MIGLQQTLGELVTIHPVAAKVFHQYGMDFCCGGQQSFGQACTVAGVDPVGVAAEIEHAAAQSPHAERWDQRPLSELIDHILSRYHAPLRTELPRLIELAGRVEQAHADRSDRPAGLALLLSQVRDAVESHLEKEEQILFPLIRAGRGHMAQMPVQVMIHEHDDHGQNLTRIRQITHDFTLPPQACASWRELYRALEELEGELMAHIHLENSVLFPRALAE